MAEYAAQLQSVAQIEICLGNPSESERLLKKSFLLAENNFDSMHVVAFSALAQLAHMLIAQDRCIEVEQLVDQYLSQAAQVLGGQSLAYAKQVNTCAEIFANESRPEAATRRRNQARAIMEKQKKR